MRATASELAAFYGVDRRTVTNWLNSTPPVPSTLEGKARVFETKDVARWHAERAARQAIEEREGAKGGAEAEADRIRLTRERVALRLAELDLAEREGALVSADTVTTVVGEIADRLRAECVNLASNYGLDLERAGVSAKDAEAVLERVSERLVRALRGAVDDVDEDEGDGGDGDGA